MAIEIERKFRVNSSEWKPSSTGKSIRQGYLSITDKFSMRVRIKGSKGFICIKRQETGFTRSEFEYDIPLEDAEVLLQMSPYPLIEKTRYKEKYENHIWEIDIFHGNNNGLVIAEIELESEKDIFDTPKWILEEVTDDSKYLNQNLAINPYNSWE